MKLYNDNSGRKPLCIIVCLFPSVYEATAQLGPSPPRCWGFEITHGHIHIHSHAHVQAQTHAPDKTPQDDWSARCKATTYTKHTNARDEQPFHQRPQFKALDRLATSIRFVLMKETFININ